MQSVPVEFLSDQEAAAFDRYGGSVPLADLERRGSPESVETSS